MKNDKETYIQELKELLKDFRDKRDWKQFHDPKNLAEAISIEAGELLELFLWKNKEDIKEKIDNDLEFKKEIQKELADVIIFSLNLANVIDLDISECVKSKIEENNKKYSINKSKGNATKYTKL